VSHTHTRKKEFTTPACLSHLPPAGYTTIFTHTDVVIARLFKKLLIKAAAAAEAERKTHIVNIDPGKCCLIEIVKGLRKKS
jgi:hypothetical protein